MTDIFPGAILRQLREWGYPMGVLRAVPPAAKALSVVHITGNSRLPSADNELSWRINDPGLQNSATFFVNRDGSIRQGLGDPLRMAPWANGDVNQPDRSNPRIDTLVREGLSANLRTIVAIENVGYEPGFPITAAQEKANAQIIAYYHRRAGVPCNRSTIIGHYQLNSVTRPNCPGRDKAVVDRIATMAHQLSEGGGATQQEDPKVIADLEEKLRVCIARWHSNRALRVEAEASLAEALAALEPLEAQLAEATLDLVEARRISKTLRARLVAIKDAVALTAAEVADA